MSIATLLSTKVGKRLSTSESPPVYIPALMKHRMIVQMTYLVAKRRGYTPGYEWRDWFEAERLIREQFPDD